MSQLLDLIGSIIIGGMVLIMLVVFHGNVMENAGVQTFKTTVHGNITTLSDVVEYDFRKMGYRVAYPQDSAIVYADSTRLTFVGDFDDNGSLDTIRYRFDSTHVAGVTNPRIGVLIRQVNNQTAQRFYLGLTRFAFRYYDYRDTLLAGNVIANPSDIKSIRLSAQVESNERYFDFAGPKGGGMANTDTSFAGVYWERKFTPKNIR